MKRTLQLSLLFLVLVVFCYFRLKPIYLQTVPYTYDQGRDFLKAAEIVRDKNITFIGPTTGIQGLFHGVWWYYLLVIPYILTNANPIGFYYFVFFIQFASTMLFFIFLKRRFGPMSALFFLSIVASSPYLISTSFFPINSVLVIPFILLLCYSLFELGKQEKLLYGFLLGLSLTSIFEAELAFGLFLIPAFIVTVISNKIYRKIIFTQKILYTSILGLLLPLLPRILFELKNNFLQTKTIISFFTNPSSTNTTTFKGVLIDRFNLFKGYYGALFTPDFSWMFALGLILICTVYVLNKSKRTVKNSYFQFFLVLIFFVFVMTLVYRNNFFWGNYLEGFSYFFLIPLSIAIAYITKLKKPAVQYGLYVLFIFIAINFIFSLHKSITQETVIAGDGLWSHTKAVDTIYSLSNSDSLCVRIYTPPVIPHTYNYLFQYNADKKNKPYPGSDFIDGRCWYVIERDDNGERRQKWLDANLPKGGAKSREISINDNIVVQLWQTN